MKIKRQRRSRTNAGNNSKSASSCSSPSALVPSSRWAMSSTPVAASTSMSASRNDTHHAMARSLQGTILGALPADLLVHVMSMLSHESICHLAQSCKAWYQFACDNEVWAQCYSQRWPRSFAKRKSDLLQLENRLSVGAITRRRKVLDDSRRRWWRDMFQSDYLRRTQPCKICTKRCQKRCGKCFTVFYCSKEHQLRDWFDGGHKRLCMLLHGARKNASANNQTHVHGGHSHQHSHHVTAHQQTPQVQVQA